MHPHYAKTNYPVLFAAYREAKALCDAGNGFTFRIRTKSGDTFEGIPSSAAAIEVPENGIILVEIGSDTVVVPSHAIETITVVACA